VFFTTCIANDPGHHHQLFVRLAGTRTLEVSKPLDGCVSVPCFGAAGRGSADFAGASESGTVVFFTAPLAVGQSALVPGGSDRSNNLYVATIGCPEGDSGCGVSERVVTSLVDASHDPMVGQAAEVQGTVDTAPDGSRAYFVARGVLSEGVNAQGVAPIMGADNLYMYERATGRVVFVADLCSGYSLSGTTEDVKCPNATGVDKSLWTGGASEAQMAGLDGRYLVFSSYGQLVAGDTDAARDVYRYDAQTGTLTRVSIGEAGYHDDGNDSEFDATIDIPYPRGGPAKFQAELNSRAVSEDGSRIVFTTSEPLSSHAINGLPDVYEWHQEPGNGEGVVSMISSGSSVTPDGRAVIARDGVPGVPEGRDVFFTTSQGLVAQDTDGAPDVYDARIGGGFQESSASRLQCSSDACQGPLTTPAPLLVPGSVSQAPGGNFVAPTPKKKPKAKVKKSATKKSRGKKKRSRTRGKASGRSYNVATSGREVR